MRPQSKRHVKSEANVATTPPPAPPLLSQRPGCVQQAQNKTEIQSCVRSERRHTINCIEKMLLLSRTRNNIERNAIALKNCGCTFGKCNNNTAVNNKNEEFMTECVQNGENASQYALLSAQSHTKFNKLNLILGE